jgi:glyoxylase-like metal-dependent hydrolase (beta-lactamase superfamily II)
MSGMGTANGFGVLRRRDVLKLMGGAVAAAQLVPTRAMAVDRLTLGDAEVVTVTDGTLTLPMAYSFGDVPKEELVRLLEENGLPTDALRPDCNVTVLRRGGRLVVFDAGAGPAFMDTAGKLVAHLAEAGIDPADVTDVVFTHAHPDHIWGVTDDFDELVFANARYHIGQAEFDFWSSPDALKAVSEDRQSFVVGAQNRFEAIGDRLGFVKAGAEPVPGVEAVSTPGHTPGHMSYVVHGGTDQLVIIGDAVTQSVISFVHPEWPAGADQDQALAIKTRKILLDRLSGDRARVVGYHFPHPATGMVERNGSAFRFVQS